MRLDKYLKTTRLIKRRTIANEACDAGKLIVNGKTARASYEVKVGDEILINMGTRPLKVKVLSIQENARKENELAEKFVLVKDMEFELNQFENKYGLKWMDDEDILEMADYVEKIMKILDKYRKE